MKPGVIVYAIGALGLSLSSAAAVGPAAGGGGQFQSPDVVTGAFALSLAALFGVVIRWVLQSHSSLQKQNAELQAQLIEIVKTSRREGGSA